MKTFGSGQSRLGVWLSVVAFGAVAGYIYVSVHYGQDPNAEGSPWLGAFIGVAITCLASGFEFFVVSNPDSSIRNLAFIPLLLVRVIVISVFVLLSVLSGQFLYDLIYGTSLLNPGEGAFNYVIDVGFSLVAAAGIIFFLQMRLFIGARTLGNLILGKYNNPKHENRIFMIVDVVGSTAAAQQLGDIRFHRFLNRLFILFDTPILRYGGEVHSYVGDAIIAIWPLTSDKKKNARPILAAMEIDQLCKKRSRKITAKFGIVPRVRIALHGGPVVAGETGLSKRQITYLGDTINMASRIEAKAKELDRDFLISSDLLNAMALPDSIQHKTLGDFQLKGAQSEISLAQLQFNSNAEIVA